MTREFLAALICTVFLIAAAAPTHAVAPDSPLYDQALRGGERIDTLAPISTLAPVSPGTRADTVWFGGDDGNGIAFEGGIWDWDTIVSDPFQGWTSVDMTDNPGVYFQWANADSFIVHGDPCIPCFPGSSALIWCGIHEDEANERDFIGGMGYQNDMCQRAFSPEFSIEPAADSIDISFDYFNDTEPDYDYTYIYVLCYDSVDELIEEHEVDYLHGIIGSPDDPATYTAGLSPGTLDPATSTVKLEFRMESDAGYSDEDGQWNTECGPFGADNVGITVGASGEIYDFNDGPQGWTFEKCEGIGTFMAVVPEGLWSRWTDYAGVTCECDLDGNAVSFVDLEGSPFWPPGHVVGQYERAISGVVPRSGYEPPAYNHTLCEWDHYVYLRASAGTLYRPGYMFFPYSTETHPEPHWSPRMGQAFWSYTGNTPDCHQTRASFSSPWDGTPMPAEWDSMRAVYEIATSCDMFDIPPWLCEYEGETWGSPVIDNFRVGLTRSVDAPHIVLETGHLFMDGFGQRFPLYLEPGDVGNSNISYDHSRNSPSENDWLSDTAMVIGPQVEEEDERWLVELCFQLTRIGPRQEMIPGYHEWKARFTADPEECFVCARLDSFENFQGSWPHKYHTYFHEDDPGFDPNYPDLKREQEILRDSLFTPGTQVEYYYRGSWYNGGAPPEDYHVCGPWEFEILPGMRACGGGYDFEYPCILYIDAYNRGAEYYIVAMLEQLGVEFDKYDFLDASSSWDAPMKRSFGGTHFNPGGWGNNGCTTEQLLGYRLILLNTGTFGSGALEHNNMPANEEPDFVLLREWLNSNACGLGNIRRGLIMNGDQIAQIMDGDYYPSAPDFCNNDLGVEYIAQSYREYNNDDAYCVYLEPASGAVFEPSVPGIGLYGSGCPQEFHYNVLGIHPGVSGVAGNLRYHSYQGTGDEPYVEYAQVVRENVQPGVANWTTVVDGFSLHHLAERGFGGEDCSSDSASVVTGGLDLLIPELLGWMTDPDDPFDPWRYPCTDTGVDEEGESHLSGPVTYLFPSRPNPFMRAATIRFSLASSGQVSLSIYDVSGRLVRRLVDGEMDAGEHSAVWDGADDRGRQVGAGVFWMQLATHSGYRSSKRLLVLK